MARSKTGSFWLTEAMTGTTASASTLTGTIDLGAYVDAGDGQALAIEEVDFITQLYNTSSNDWTFDYQGGINGDCSMTHQLSDLNPGAQLLRADDNSLIASGTLLFDDSANLTALGPDLYPDSFGKLDEARMVVNDQLYYTFEPTTATAANNQYVAVCRIKCRIVKLSSKDWMAIAIQSTAADN